MGRILKQLEEAEEMDETLIVWTSDHGEFLGDYGCFGKRSFLDAAARVPLIILQPGRFPEHSVEDTSASLVDLIPTFLGVAGVSGPAADLDGVDLAGIVGGGESRTIYGQM